MKTKLFRLSLYLFLAVAGSISFTSCSKEAFARLGEPPRSKELPENWKPEEVTMAKHISGVHAFSIGPEPGSHLRVTRQENEIIAEFRPDVLEKLGSQKALFILGWESNPQTCTRSDYLFFLEGLHAMLVMSAAEWRGDH